LLPDVRSRNTDTCCKRRDNTDNGQGEQTQHEQPQREGASHNLIFFSITVSVTSVLAFVL
jgi:hypothetical protein